VADRVELIDYVPRRESLRLQRDSDALLLLIPEAGGPRARRPLGEGLRVPRGRAGPILAVVPETARRRSSFARPVQASSPGPKTSTLSATRSSRCTRNGATAHSPGTPLPPEWRDRLSRAVARRGARRAPGVARMTAVAARRAAAPCPARGVTRALLFATLFCVTFEKVHWNLAGTLELSDVLTILFLVAVRADGPRGHAAHECDPPRLLRGVSARVPRGLLQSRHEAGRRPVHEGDGEVRPPLPVPRHERDLPRAARQAASTGGRSAGSRAGFPREPASTGSCSSAAAKAGHNLDKTVLSPLTGGASSINIYGSVGGSSGSTARMR